MTLNELKPHGYKLSDVEPDFQGMPYFEWWQKKITQQCDVFIESPLAKEWAKIRSDQKWFKKGIH